MQNRPYSELFTLASNLIGSGELEASTEQPQLASFIERRFLEAYKKSPIWPRYMVSGEPRTLGPDQVVPFAEDSFYIHASGKEAVHGLYTYGPEYSNHNSYILNGDSLSFRISEPRSSGDPRMVGTYKLDASYQIHNTYNRGVWVNQDNPNIVFTSDAAQNSWSLYDISADSVIDVEGGDSYFPWHSDLSYFGTFVDFPEVAYNIERNDSNNHWELIQQNATGDAIVLYKDGNGNIPSETVWEIVNAANPAPIVHDVDDISDFIRVHKTKSFLNKSAYEYDYYVDPIGAHLLNVSGNTNGLAYVTYKKKFTPFSVTENYYTDDTNVPEEFFNYIAHAAYSDFLRIQGRTELAQTEGALAEEYLNMELEKLNNINSLNAMRRISTHVSRQSRTL